jgi:hypothetical protein
MKSHFEGQFIDLRRGIGKDTWYLAAPLRYHSELAARWIEVPGDFLTDFASIPRFFHRLLPKNGTYDAAAVVHDYLYATGELHKDTADKIFREALECLGVAAWRRAAMYQAVKKFGGAAWKAHRRNDRKEEKLPVAK